MHLTATHINYFNLCHRKLWLFSNGIHMEHTSEIVADGKLLHETSYPQRASKFSEIELYAEFEGIKLSGKIDFYNAQDKIVHETKRSNKVETSHEWQVKFYLWLLLMNGILGATGTLEYPLLRKKDSVVLSEKDILKLKSIVFQIAGLIQKEYCPPLLNSSICKSCSYYELCYINEVSEDFIPGKMQENDKDFFN